MQANNLNQLNTILMRELVKAMNVTSDKVLADMYGETGKFYTKGKPKMYQRTGALGDTPKTTALTVGGNTVSFEAYLDESTEYTTGKNPSMHDVLELANYGNTNSSVGYLRPTLGKKGFWEQSEKKMEKTFERTLRQFFK